MFSVLSWKVFGPNYGTSSWRSLSTARQVIKAITAVSKIPRKREAVKKETAPTIMTGPQMLETVVLVICFITKQREKQFPTVIAIFPRRMKTLAIKFAKVNLRQCLTLRRNPFQAELQKLSPVTAM
jgi:hypothetical protein